MPRWGLWPGIFDSLPRIRFFFLGLWIVHILKWLNIYNKCYAHVKILLIILFFCLANFRLAATLRIQSINEIYTTNLIVSFFPAIISFISTTPIITSITSLEVCSEENAFSFCNWMLDRRILIDEGEIIFHRPAAEWPIPFWRAFDLYELANVCARARVYITNGISNLLRGIITTNNLPWNS